MTNGYQQGTAPAAKKGLGPLAWVAIGCGAVILVGLVILLVGGFFLARKGQELVADFEDNPAKAAAELMVRMDSDLELVESDGEKGRITVRQVSTGEVATFDYSEIEEGRLSFKTDEGEVSIDASAEQDGGTMTVKTDEGVVQYSASADAGDVPDWVPLYPDATKTVGGATASTPEGFGGTVHFETGDEPREVLDYYEEKLKEEGYSVFVQTTSSGEEGPQGSVIAQDSASKRMINVMVVKKEGVTQLGIHYSQQNQ
ncbi:MAG: hypothetical protein GY856_36145 [bacterium]|nr:hypothetical protein [bacterium]